MASVAVAGDAEDRGQAVNSTGWSDGAIGHPARAIDNEGIPVVAAPDDALEEKRVTQPTEE
jgi:hypothetical protein